MYIFIKPLNFSFFSITGWDIVLDYCDVAWFAWEMNRDHSVVSETAHKYCILDSFVMFKYDFLVSLEIQCATSYSLINYFYFNTILDCYIFARLS